MSRPTVIAGIIWFALAGLAVAAETAPRAVLLSEAPMDARLVGIDREWNLSFAVGDKVRVVAAENVAWWGGWRDVAAGPQILLSGGGIIRADVLKLDDQTIVLGDATAFGRGLWDESTLSRQALRAILYQPPADAASRDKLIDRLAQPSASGEDQLLLVGGESIAGTLTAAPLDGRFRPENAQPEGAAFQLTRRGADQPLTVPASKVIAISFGTPATPALPVPQAVWLGFRDGSLVQASAVEVKDGAVHVKLADGGTLVTTLAGRDDPSATFWDEVTLVQPSSTRVAWLSELPNLGYKHIPFLSIDWPFAADRSVLGGQLRSGKTVYLKGLGMHSTSRLAYDVAGYKRFAAELALDDSAGLQGSVTFRVLLLDGSNTWQSAYESPVVRGGDAPLPISLDLKNASRMALIVEFADRGDAYDHANWLNARLVK